MKETYSPALTVRRALLVALLTVLFATEVGWAVLLGLAIALVRARPDLGLGWTITPLAVLLAASSWAYLWCRRTHAPAARFGWRPAEPGDDAPAPSQASRHALWAAAEAFDQGRFERVPELLDRVPVAERGRSAWLLLGRALALAGRPEEAAAGLEAGGEGRRGLGLVRPPRFFSAGPAFADAGLPLRLRRIPWIGALALVLAAACAASWRAFPVRAAAARTAAFDESEFKSLTEGRVTFYYHGDAFREFAAPIAQAALAADMDFLGLQAGAFRPGEIRLYLCDSQAEFRRRAPSFPAWEAACAEPARATIYIYRMDRLPFEVVLAHELGHLCYYRLVGKSPDDWLNEGLADYLGFRFGLDREGVPRQAWLQDHFFRGLRSRALPFGRFFSLDPHDLPDAQVATFYCQGFSIVYMLVEDYGRDAFMDFLRASARGARTDDALAAAYPTIPNIQALAAVWGLFYPPRGGGAESHP